MTALWLLIALALGWVGFAYVGYPLLLFALARLSPRPVAKGDATPPLSIIIAVHNGEDRLAAKLEQTLALDYPGPRQLIVASDGSTDETNAIAKRFAEKGVELSALAEQTGKEAAQAEAIRHATGEILVFTDLGAKLESDALRAIVRPFADASVGSVSSEDVVETEGGEGAYVRFEMALRRFESEAATLIGLSGSFFAVRRELAEPWPTNLASDFRSALESARRGLRAVSEPGARARFTAVSDPAREWTRKVRTVRRGLAVLTAYRGLLHPRYGRAALAVWGHKVARFTAPWALVLLLLASTVAAPASPLAAGLLLAQLLGYGMGSAALLQPALQRFLLPRLAAFFMLVNGSILVAWRYHLAGEPAVLWQPTRR
jgi:cellulose synthase/poly-beta-1,6-N-acetylglucosamine synthase-like glycosyltransferase